MNLRTALVFGIAGFAAAPAGAQQKGVDVQSYHFRVEIPDSGSTIHGVAQVRFRAGVGYDDTLRLNLVGMTVARVGDLSTGAVLPFAYDGTVLRVALRGRGDLGVLVDYSGAPRDGLIIRTNARGRRAAFGDDWPNRARYWLPTVDHPSDKARVAWEIVAPRGWRTVANAPQCRPAGAAPDCTESALTPTYTMVIGATEMTVSRHRPALVGRDSVPIEVWAYPEDSAFADSVPFARATEIVETMSRIVGPFPFSKLAHVESSTRYGGMENSTAIFYAELPYVRRTMREGVVRHETAHQWFGDAVTPREWAHLWLSEGFASYFDLVIGAALSGDSVLTNGMRADARAWKASSVTGRPMVDTVERDPNKLLNSNVYPKGAWVLHMLRGIVGDSAFFAGMREYYRRYRDSSVVSAQFQAVMERAANKPLDWFFRQWLYQPGCPQLDVTWTVDSAARVVHLAVRQVQPAAWGRWRLPALPVAFAMPGGAMERRTVDLLPSDSVSTFTLPLRGAMPVGLSVDPDTTLLLDAKVHP